MIQPPRQYQSQLAVVGTGLAGMAATIFALKHGIKVVQAGNTGAIAYTSGYFDLLGKHQDKLLDDPWQGIDALRRDEPGHPLCTVSNADILTAFTVFTESISSMGVGYTRPGNGNNLALTPVGSTKPTFVVPATMSPGIAAKHLRKKTVIVDFVGLPGFSAKEVVANLRHDWPQASAVTLEFPDNRDGAQLYPEVMARMLEVPLHRQQLAERIIAVRGDAGIVGLPAIMGIHEPDKVHAELQRLVGLPLFEIPTMPPAVPGIRLREMFEQFLPAQGATLIPQHKVQRMDLDSANATLHLKDSYGDVEIEAEAILLATGRFLSGGLRADRNGIQETLLGIPITQPRTRDEWYRQHYFDPRGHVINRCGVQVDDAGRPLDSDGQVMDRRLFAAGIVLAGQDWVRQRCGAGIAIVSAWKAVQSIKKMLESA